jgi:hypothetical protein
MDLCGAERGETEALETRRELRLEVVLRYVKERPEVSTIADGTIRFRHVHEHAFRKGVA